MAGTELGNILDRAANECAEWWIANLTSLRVPLTPAVGASVLTRCIVMGMGVARRCGLKDETMRTYLLGVAFVGVASAEEALSAARAAYDRIEARREADKANGKIEAPVITRRKG